MKKIFSLLVLLGLSMNSSYAYQKNIYTDSKTEVYKESNVIMSNEYNYGNVWHDATKKFSSYIGEFEFKNTVLYPKMNPTMTFKVEGDKYSKAYVFLVGIDKQGNKKILGRMININSNSEIIVKNIPYYEKYNIEYILNVDNVSTTHYGARLMCWSY